MQASYAVFYIIKEQILKLEETISSNQMQDGIRAELERLLNELATRLLGQQIFARHIIAEIVPIASTGRHTLQFGLVRLEQIVEHLGEALKRRVLSGIFVFEELTSRRLFVYRQRHWTHHRLLLAAFLLRFHCRFRRCCWLIDVFLFVVVVAQIEHFLLMLLL